MLKTGVTGRHTFWRSGNLHCMTTNLAYAAQGSSDVIFAVLAGLLFLAVACGVIGWMVMRHRVGR